MLLSLALLMSAAPPWFALNNTLPTPTTIDELPAPSPYILLDQLVSGEKSKPLPCTFVNKTEDAAQRTSHGICGTKDKGYKWREVTSKKSSSVPVSVEVELVGIDGINLTWLFALMEVDQGVHTFKHRSLRVRFQDDAAKKRFSTLFHEHFGIAPSWGQP
jgi:hypothetical protein